MVTLATGRGDLMRIALCSDEPYDFHDLVVAELERLGHEVIRFGSLQSGREEPWTLVAQAAAEAIAFGDCDEGIFFCWTGTGISMAANKIPGIRAALCGDSETAQGARVWNHANVLALSNRLMKDGGVIEIVKAWLDAPKEDSQGKAGVEQLALLDAHYRKQD